MSYLDVPRIHLGGSFFTDPSTINNDPAHYEPDCTNPSPWQEPNGQHRFQLKDVMVKSATSPTGAVTNDTIIGVSVETTDDPGPAKIVDIDVYQQNVPTIFGAEIKISFSDGTFVKGKMDQATLDGLWFTAVLPTRGWNEQYGQDSNGGDMNACGYFQSVIRVSADNWTNTSSTILNLLKSSTIQDADGNYLVSIKFVMDGYENVEQNENFRYGRFVGTLGVVKANEPLYNAGQRWMQPRALDMDTAPWNWPNFNPCIYKVDTERKKLVFDLANSICRVTAGGDPVDLGNLTAFINTPGNAPVEVGPVDYNAFVYENSAQIAEVDLTDDQVALLENGGISLQTSKTDIGAQTILSDDYAKYDFAVEVRPLRMEGNVGTTAAVRVFVSKNGVPAVGKQLNIALYSVYGTTPGITVPPGYIGDTPQSEGALEGAISVSDANGFATINLVVTKDPGYRTTQLDGQLYFVVVYDPDYPNPYWRTSAPIQENLLSVIVFSQYTVNENPTWDEMREMMVPYMKLYPSMRTRVDLTDEHTVTVFAANPPWDVTYPPTNPGPLGLVVGAIPYYMSRDFDDPRFMPVTRDLSANKILTYMYFCKNIQENPPS